MGRWWALEVGVGDEVEGGAARVGLALKLAHGAWRANGPDWLVRGAGPWVGEDGCRVVRVKRDGKVGSALRLEQRWG